MFGRMPSRLPNSMQPSGPKGRLILRFSLNSTRAFALRNSIETRGVTAGPPHLRSEVQDEIGHVLEHIGFTGRPLAQVRCRAGVLRAGSLDSQPPNLVGFGSSPRAPGDFRFAADGTACGDFLDAISAGRYGDSPRRRFVLRSCSTRCLFLSPERVVTFHNTSGALIAGPITYDNALGEVLSRQRLVFTELGTFSKFPFGRCTCLARLQGKSEVLRAGSP